jgi:hypothetical protein
VAIATVCVLLAVLAAVYVSLWLAVCAIEDEEHREQVAAAERRGER